MRRHTMFSLCHGTVMNRLRLLVSVAALLAASSAYAEFAPSQVIFPPQSLPIRFSHKLHLGQVPTSTGKKIKAECEDCHEKATSSLSSADSLLPTEDSCTTCHPVDRDNPNKVVPEGKAPARCSACHVVDPADPKSPHSYIPDPNLKFNHKIHADREIGCVECHASVDKEELATREGLPKMQRCLKCHNQVATANRAPAKCSTCHRTGPDGLLVTEFASGTLSPSGTLKGDRHTPDFATRHAQVAQQDEKYCLNCHQRSYCLSCHNGVVKPMSFHGNDYLMIHPIDARKATTKCEGCHRRQTFCLGCHERSGVTDRLTADGPNRLGSATPPRRFHPPFERWTAGPRTPEHHSWQAERNVKACAACHREESCIECHATQGANVNGLSGSRPFFVSPHPPGFAGSRECNAMRSRSGRMCLKCHRPDDPNLGCM